VTGLEPRIILRQLIERIEATIGNASPADFCAWEGKEEEAALGERATAGRLHLANAASLARDALASGDEKDIVDAALICPTLERKGLEMSALYSEQAKRRKGGVRRGAAKAAAADEFWAPWQAILYEKMQSGMSERAARQIVKRQVKRQLTKSGITVPSEPTFRKWLRKKTES
jgi:hypothetical protein